jgi:hypothetical protein
MKPLLLASALALCAAQAHAQAPGFPFPFGNGFVGTKVFHYEPSQAANDWTIPAFGRWIDTGFGYGSGHNPIYHKRLSSTWLFPVVFGDVQGYWANNETSSVCLALTIEPFKRGAPLMAYPAYKNAAVCVAAPSGKDVTITFPNAPYLAYPPAGDYIVRLWAYAYPDSTGCGAAHYTLQGATQVQIIEAAMPHSDDPEWWSTESERP